MTLGCKQVIQEIEINNAYKVVVVVDEHTISIPIKKMKRKLSNLVKPKNGSGKKSLQIVKAINKKNKLF